jgi:mRNA-degrading endonuclease YafQ of YafQ-DinJ toxin-antitoxin module
MFVLNLTNHFKKKYQKITKNNLELKLKIQNVLEILEKDPQSSQIGSHKVNTSNFGQVWSSRVTPDIRIIWQYNQNNQVNIYILTIGGHDSVYI